MGQPAIGPPCDLCGNEPAAISQMSLDDHSQVLVGYACMVTFYTSILQALTGQDPDLTEAGGQVQEPAAPGPQEPPEAPEPPAEEEAAPPAAPSSSAPRSSRPKRGGN